MPRQHEDQDAEQKIRETKVPKEEPVTKVSQHWLRNRVMARTDRKYVEENTQISQENG